MAQYPCDICGIRYRGPQQTMYPALLHHSVSLRFKRRMCPDCFSEALDWLQIHATPVDVLDQRSTCANCGADSPALAFFCTLYARGEDRADFYAYVCSSCALHQILPLFFGPLEASEVPFVA